MREALGVAVTRAREDCDVLVRALTHVELQPVVTPLLRFALLDPAPLAACLESASQYDWLVCTSRHAVQQLAVACETVGIAPAEAGFVHVGAVGEGTARALRGLGLAIDLLPSVSDAAHLAGAMLSVPIGANGRFTTCPRVLFPRAGAAREDLPSMLRAEGWTVDDVACYETLPCEDGAAQLSAALSSGALGAVTLASGSACRAMAALVPPTLWSLAHLVSIGPTTTAAARDAGLTIAAQAPRPAMDALAATARRTILDSHAHA